MVAMIPVSRVSTPARGRVSLSGVIQTFGLDRSQAGLIESCLVICCPGGEPTEISHQISLVRWDLHPDPCRPEPFSEGTLSYVGTFETFDRRRGPFYAQELLTNVEKHRRCESTRDNMKQTVDAAPTGSIGHSAARFLSSSLWLDCFGLIAAVISGARSQPTPEPVWRQTSLLMRPASRPGSDETWTAERRRRRRLRGQLIAKRVFRWRRHSCADGLRLQSSALNLERKLWDGAAERVRFSLFEWLLERGRGLDVLPGCGRL